MTDHEHLTEEICAALYAGKKPEDLPENLLEHLLSHCPECFAVWRSYIEAHGLPGGNKLSDAAWKELDRIFEATLPQAAEMRRRVDEERKAVDKLMRELETLPDLAARVMRVRRSKRFRSWTLCDRLLTKSRALSFEHPIEAAEVAELAIETAWALDDGDIGRALISDLMARGWALLANARRLAGQLELAHETFAMTRVFFEQGSSDPLVEAELAGLAALIYRDRCEPDAAGRLHDRCVAIYRRVELEPQLALALLQRSITRAGADQLDAAAEDQRQALELLGEKASLRLRLCAQHLLISTLIQLGEAREARRRFKDLRASERPPLDPWSQLRELRLEAALARGEASRQAQAATDRRLAESGIFHRSMPPGCSLVGELAKGT